MSFIFNTLKRLLREDRKVVAENVVPFVHTERR